MKVFYDHLILIDELFSEIEMLEMSQEEQESAKKLVDDIFHHEILSHILQLLPKSHHETFLIKFYDAPFDTSHIHFLSETIQIDIVGEIVKKGEKVKKNLKKELKKHKKKL